MIQIPEKLYKNLHVEFGHRCDQLIPMIKQAGLLTNKIESDIKDISKECDVCLQHAKKPRNPKGSTEINQNINDLVYIGGCELGADFDKGFKEVIKCQHVVDCHSGYSWANLTSYDELGSIRSVMRYAEGTGSFPKVPRSDDHSSYRGKEFQLMVNKHGTFMICAEFIHQGIKALKKKEFKLYLHYSKFKRLGQICIKN